MTDRTTIQQRMIAAKKGSEYKQYLYNLRQVFFGNYEAIGGPFGARLSQETLSHGDANNKTFPDFRVGEMAEGSNNQIQSIITTLTMQVLIKKPDIVFADLSPKVSSFREQYLIDRLNKTKWVAEQETGIVDYLINGIAVWHVNVEQGMPSFIRVDPLRTFWDPFTRYPNKSRFVGILWKVPREFAVSKLGAKVVNKISKQLPGDNKDDTVSFIEYWDKETRAILHPTSDDVLSSTKNDFGFIPIVFYHGPILPSASSPYPHLLNMIPLQVASAEIDKQINETVKAMRPIVIIDESAFTTESIANYELSDGDISVLVKTDNTRAGIEIIKPGELSAQILTAKANYDEQLRRQGMFNPFALGASIDPKFAAEVNAIEASAGLFAGYVSNNLGASLAELFQMMIKLGHKFDRNLLVVASGEKQIVSNEFNDLKVMLRTDVPCEVTSASFETESVRIRRSIDLLNIITADPSLGTPALKNTLMQRLLEALNLRNPDGLLQVPDQDAKAELVRDMSFEELQQILQIGIQAVEQQQAGPVPG